MNLPETYWTHPKTQALASLLGRNSEILPLRFWAYVNTHWSRDGRLTKCDPQGIERAVGWWGEPGKFVAAMEQVGWLERLPEGQPGWQCHQWAEHQGPRIRLEEAEARCEQVLAAAWRTWQTAVAAMQEEARKDRAMDQELAQMQQEAQRARCAQAGRASAEARARKKEESTPLATPLAAPLPADVPEYSSTSNKSGTSTCTRPDLNRIIVAKSPAEAETSGEADLSSNEAALEEMPRNLVPPARDTYGTGMPKETQEKSKCSLARERHIMGIMRHELGEAEMARMGGYWRLELRKDPNTMVGLLADLQAMKKEGVQIDNWGAYFMRMHKDWKQKRAAVVTAKAKKGKA